MSQPSEIFVFGSNLEGIHGRGAAKYAYIHHGAVMGVGNGQHGNSYALPTKLTPYKPLPLTVIRDYIWEFIHWVRVHDNHIYMLTPVGCGLAGFETEKIAKIFKRFKPPENLRYPREFVEFIPSIQNRPDLIANFPDFDPNL